MAEVGVTNHLSASPNVRWHKGDVVRAERWAAFGLAGATVWFTGLPGSGKSTVAAALECHLTAAGIPAFLLDGDNLRHGLNADLGFSPADRDENVRRAAEVARLFADAGLIAIASLVSPYAEGRRRARAIHEASGLRFVEVFVDTSLAECERRDPKGLYVRARRGQLTDLTGVDDVYERPRLPELELGCEALSVDQAVEEVVAVLTDLDLLPVPHRRR